MKAVKQSLRRFQALRFFPSDAGALEEIGGIFEELCKTDDEARMLTDAVLRSCDEWQIGRASCRERV